MELRPGASGGALRPDDETLGHAPPEAVPPDNLVVFLSTPLKILMKFLVLKLSHCNEEKEKGDFTS